MLITFAVPQRAEKGVLFSLYFEVKKRMLLGSGGDLDSPRFLWALLEPKRMRLIANLL